MVGDKIKGAVRGEEGRDGCGRKEDRERERWREILMPTGHTQAAADRLLDQENCDVTVCGFDSLRLFQHFNLRSNHRMSRSSISSHSQRGQEASFVRSVEE